MSLTVPVGRTSGSSSRGEWSVPANQSMPTPVRRPTRDANPPFFRRSGYPLCQPGTPLCTRRNLRLQGAARPALVFIDLVYLSHVTPRCIGRIKCRDRSATSAHHHRFDAVGSSSGPISRGLTRRLFWVPGRRSRVAATTSRGLSGLAGPSVLLML
jgi:hypothetical protein